MPISTLQSGSFPSNVAIDTDTLVVDGANNRVGIGTASPTQLVDIAHSGSQVAGAVRIGDPSSISSNTGIYMRTTGLATIGAAGGTIVFDTNFGSSEKVRIDSDGLKFNGDTAAANALDDYEEGEWNPVVNAPGRTLTGGAQKGWYTKIGNMVFFKASIYHTGASGTSTGNLSISGLPFTSAAYDGDNIASGAMGTNDNAWGAITPTHWRVGWASTTISLHTKDSSDARDSSQSEVDASNYVGYATMRFTGMYWV